MALVTGADSSSKGHLGPQVVTSGENPWVHRKNPMDVVFTGEKSLNHGDSRVDSRSLQIRCLIFLIFVWGLLEIVERDVRN